MNHLIRTEIFQQTDILTVICLIFGILIFASTLFLILGWINPQLNLKELKSRTNSWWVMVLLFMVVIFLDKKISFLAIAFLSFVTFRELYSILGLRESDRRAIFWALVAIPIQYYLAYIGWYGAFIIFIPVVMFLFVPLRLVLQGDTVGIIRSMSTLQWSLMLSVFGVSHIAYLLSMPELPGFVNGGVGLLLFLVFLTEINDVMQFIWGKLLGKHKITPRVSPNKTWEGFVGGLASTTLIGYGLSFLTPLLPWQVILVSFVVALAGFCGDLVMSATKRDLGIKDTGSTIPGHGGILDRMDSLIYTAPVFFHLVYYIAY